MNIPSDKTAIQRHIPTLVRLPRLTIDVLKRVFAKSFSRRMIRRYLFVLACLVTFFALFCTVEHWRGRVALEAWKKEMRAKGEKFGIEELVSPPSVEAENRTRMFYKVTEQLTNWIVHTSLLSDIPINPMTVVSPGHAQVTWATNGSKADVEKWNSYAQRLEAGSQILKQIRGMLKDPPRTIGLGRREFVFAGKLGWHLLEKRRVAQTLVAAMLNDIHQGNRDAALENLHAIALLARMHRDDPVLVNLMVRVAISGIGLNSTWDALQAPGWNDAQLMSLQNDWEKQEFLDAMVRTIEMERAFIFWYFDFCHQSSFRESVWYPSSDTFFMKHVYFPMWEFAWSDQDELFYLQSLQPVVEDARLKAASKSWINGQPMMEGQPVGLKHEFEGVPGTYNRLRFRVSSKAHPSFTGIHWRIMQMETQRQMTIVAIALKRYDLRHGKPAPNLEALVPELLSAVPLDSIDGKPLRYHPNPDGTFTLYSVGEDGRDHGGDPSPRSHQMTGTIWDGHDAVWPMPAWPAKTEVIQIF